MKNFLILLLMSSAYLPSRASGGEYAVSKIPAELIKDAYAVKRYEDVRFEVESISRSRLSIKYAVTILNENGDRFASFVQGYDKLREIKSIEGTLYDETGKKIKSLKKGDIRDFSGTDEGTLADDNRTKVHNFNHQIYPYTVEYEFEIKYDGTFMVPDFSPQDRYNLSVQQSRLEIDCPEWFKIRYKGLHFTGEPVVKTEKGNKSFTWEATNISAIEREAAAPSLRDVTSSVMIAPIEFQMEKQLGSNASWEEFGKFILALKQNRDVLPEDIKQVVHRLTDGLPNTIDKIRKLYEYLQSNTRYISIQLGIGGLQPFDATFVATKKYGDCKALSNFMFALLKEAGIRSHYTAILAGDDKDEIIADFPMSQFNHVILCVPLTNDTVWLECTSQTTAPGYMGSFTGNRYALLITEEGGKLVRTPKYGISDNLQLRKINAVIDENGSLNIQAITRYSARQQDEMHSLINSLSKGKVMEFLKEQIQLPNYDVLSFDYKEVRNKLPYITENLNIVANNYAQVTGKRLFISPNILSKIHRRLIANDSRKFDIDLGYEYTDIDSIEIKLPPGYTPEAVPPAVKVESKFGTYNSSVKIVDDKILYYRKMEQFSGRFPAKDYGELVKFYDQVYRADHNKVVFVKK